MKRIQFSVSKAKEYNNFLLQTKFAKPTLDEVFKSYLEPFVPNEFTKTGNVIHDLIEKGGVMSNPGGHEFDGKFISVKSLQNVIQFAKDTAPYRSAELKFPKTWRFVIDGFEIILSGRIDGMFDHWSELEDHKVKSSTSKPDQYEPLAEIHGRDVQWQVYCAVTGAQRFRYNQFWFNPQSGVFELYDVVHLKRYPGLVWRMRDMFLQLFEELIQTGYADALAEHQKSWINKRWPEEKDTWLIPSN